MCADSVVKECRLSVIVPVFNCEQHIARCVESLQNQTFKNWVAIFVNDGSTDASQSILESYALDDSRIHIVNKSNGGAASARNVALDLICTEFIAMVDADDAVVPEAFELMVNAAISTNCDIVVAPRTQYCEDGTESTIYPKCVGFKKACPKFFFRSVYRGPVAKLFRKSIIDRYGLRMPEDMIVAEDYVFVTSYWTCCKNVYSIPKVVYKYYYSQNNNSLFHRFCRRELSYDAYRLYAIAPYRTFVFLVSKGGGRAARENSGWIYELYRELWKLTYNALRYINTQDDKRKLIKEVLNCSKEMEQYVSFFKRSFMIYRYLKLIPIVVGIKKILNWCRKHV